MKVLVVTGGIGSGKSLVCSVLSSKYGIPVYEADKRAKELYVKVPSLLEEIEVALGLSLRNSDGRFVPAQLAEVIFSDASALGMVEDILFPVLKKDFLMWAEKSDSSLVAFESATVLEKPQFDDFGDIVLLVNAPVSLRMQRAMVRDGLTEEEIRSRMEAQPLMNRLSSGCSHPRVDYVLDNVSSEDELLDKLADFIGNMPITKKL